MANKYRTRGTGTQMHSGYISMRRNGVRKFEHVFNAESALGKELPKGAVVHHIDGDRSNNTNSNLVICPSQEYHFLLHIRQDALSATGNADMRKCPYCKEWDEKENMQLSDKSQPESFRHKACATAFAVPRKRMARIAARSVAE